MQDLKNNRYIENLFLFNIWGVFINHMDTLLTFRHKYAPHELFQEKKNIS